MFSEGSCNPLGVIQSSPAEVEAAKCDRGARSVPDGRSTQEVDDRVLADYKTGGT